MSPHVLLRENSITETTCASLAIMIAFTLSLQVSYARQQYYFI